MKQQSHSRQPSVFVLNQFYPPDYAPTGQLIHELVSYLGSYGVYSQVFTGQPAYAFSNRKAPRSEKGNGFKIRRTQATRLWKNRIRGKAIEGMLFFVRAFLHLIRHSTKKDTLLLTTAPPFLPILGYLINLIKGTSYVCLIYDLYPDVAEQLGVVSPEHWTARLWNFLNRKTWDRAKAIIVLSPTMKEQILAKHSHLADKIEIISNWADPDWIVPLEKEKNWFAQEHHLIDKFTVLYSGNMGRCHDMDTLLEAARLLQNEPNIQFMFIGGGAKYQTSLEKIRQWGLKNCLFLPYQDRNVLPYSLTACDLSLVSVEEGMSGVVAPSKLYTTLAAGRPVAIISDEQCYLRETVEQARCGVAFLNGDSQGLASFIRELNSEAGAATAKAMGEAGRSYLIAHYTLESIVKHYAEVLGVTLQNPPQQGNSKSENQVPSQDRLR